MYHRLDRLGWVREKLVCCTRTDRGFNVVTYNRGIDGSTVKLCGRKALSYDATRNGTHLYRLVVRAKKKM